MASPYPTQRLPLMTCITDNGGFKLSHTAEVLVKTDHRLGQETRP